MDTSTTINSRTFSGSTSYTAATSGESYKSVIGLALTTTFVALTFAWTVTPEVRQPTLRYSDSQRSVVGEDLLQGGYTGRYFPYHEINWDGYKGVSPSIQAQNNVQTFLDELPNNFVKPRIGVSGDGEVGLFWEQDQIYIDIGFMGDDKYSFYARDADGAEYFGDDILVSSSIDPKLLRLISQVSH